jgi:hypothetical protein
MAKLPPSWIFECSALRRILAAETMRVQQVAKLHSGWIEWSVDMNLDTTNNKDQLDEY